MNGFFSFEVSGSGLCSLDDVIDAQVGPLHKEQSKAISAL